MAEGNVTNGAVDYSARGMAAEAVQALRSHDAMDALRFENMDKQHKELKELIIALREDMNTGFKSYDGKFWSLALVVISTLMTVVGVFGYQILFHASGGTP